jgi:hypothetical protein
LSLEKHSGVHLQILPKGKPIIIEEPPEKKLEDKSGRTEIVEVVATCGIVRHTKDGGTSMPAVPIRTRISPRRSRIRPGVLQR